MAQFVDCPHCRKSCTVPDNMGGRAARCPHCRQTFRVATTPAPPIPVRQPRASQVDKADGLIRFLCSNCQKRIKAQARRAGRKTTCPRCGQRLQIPHPPPVDNRTVLGEILPSRPAQPDPAGLHDQRDNDDNSDPELNWLEQIGFTNQTKDRDDTGYTGRRGKPQKHSGLGIASFLIAVLIGGLDVLLGIVISVGIARTESDYEFREQLLGGGRAMICLNFMSIPLCLVGIGLAVVGLVSQPRRNHVFTWIGLFVNVVVILTMLGLFLAGSLVKN